MPFSKQALKAGSLFISFSVIVGPFFVMELSEINKLKERADKAEARVRELETVLAGQVALTKLHARTAEVADAALAALQQRMDDGVEVQISADYSQEGRITMGWASGSRLFSAIIAAAKKHFPYSESRKAFYKDAIDAFTDADCDTLDECKGEDPAFDEAYSEVWPEEADDEMEEE